MKSQRERFLEKVIITDSCWLWTASLYKNGYGYGRFREGPRGSRVVRAHRWSYEHWIGPIPEGLTLDHLCRIPRCVNPDHLEPVTHAENMRRGIEGRRTHCPAGHPYSGDNLFITAKGHRKCRICTRHRQKLHWPQRAKARLEHTDQEKPNE